MKVTCRCRASSEAAFTLLEGIVAMAVVGIAFVSLYSGLTYGFARVQLSRENHRATQILIEKMETIRLYNWAQINDSKFIPSKFTVSYYPNAQGENAGTVYDGTFKVQNSDLSGNYADAMKKVTVTLTWRQGKGKRTRSLTTYVGQFGLHNSGY